MSLPIHSQEGGDLLGLHGQFPRWFCSTEVRCPVQPPPDDGRHRQFPADCSDRVRSVRLGRSAVLASLWPSHQIEPCPRRRRSAPEVSSERPVSWMVEVFLTWFWRVKVFTQSCDQPQVNDTNQSCVLAASPNVACPSPNHSRLSSLFSSFCRAIRVFLAHSSRSHGARAHAVPELKSEGTHPDPENHPPSLSQVAES